MDALLLLQPGLFIRIDGLKQRCDLNGCAAELVGPVPRVVGKPARWRVKVGSEIVAVRLTVVLLGLLRAR